MAFAAAAAAAACSLSAGYRLISCPLTLTSQALPLTNSNITEPTRKPQPIA
jgi:hypothetical protein